MEVGSSFTMQHLRQWSPRGKLACVNSISKTRHGKQTIVGHVYRQEAGVFHFGHFELTPFVRDRSRRRAATYFARCLHAQAPNIRAYIKERADSSTIPIDIRYPSWCGSIG